uniref:Uncharacterized protein n=1 Tax=Anguilla anguilla TaxID=7936 RepID=A0A0E9QL63_ANGAN
MQAIGKSDVRSNGNFGHFNTTFHTKIYLNI